ncbi:putative type IV pilus bioproteinsis protein, FimV family, partial [Pseudomonas syringae pv. atrofaciens]|uniref:FimV/HubP family polar landmark protein n=1 Tax=Pseudomonas syringae TaxID=317 RepID=UPI000F3C52BD
AAAAATTAALVAELDAKYLEELLADDSAEQEAEPEPKPEPKPEPEIVATPEPEPEVTAPLAAEPVEEADPFDNDFDLSLDEFEEPSVPEVSTVNDLDDLMLDEPKVSAVADDEELSFESVMQQQEEARAATTPQDLADFDLDLSEEDPALKSEDDFLLGLGEDPLDLGETSAVPPVSDDLELPEDFDLSLADEIETDQASQAFATEIDDVNAELERLSQNLEHPPLDEPRFTAEDAAALDDEPDFDFMSGTDEAATKLDLARAYIDMGDADGARDILDEVVTEGDDGQKSEAREMLSRLA